MPEPKKLISLINRVRSYSTPRIADNTSKKPYNDFIKLDKELQKKQAWNERRRELHKWNKRANACGIAPLPPKRPTKGQRLAWENSIVTAEGL